MYIESARCLERKPAFRLRSQQPSLGRFHESLFAHGSLLAQSILGSSICRSDAFDLASSVLPSRHRYIGRRRFRRCCLRRYLWLRLMRQSRRCCRSGGLMIDGGRVDLHGGCQRSLCSALRDGLASSDMTGPERLGKSRCILCTGTGPWRRVS